MSVHLARTAAAAVVVVQLLALVCAQDDLACPPELDGGNTGCLNDEDTSIVQDTTGSPLLDSWRIFASDTKARFNPLDVLPLDIGKTKAVGISITNQLASRVDDFGERETLLDEITKLYHNVYEVRVRFLNRGRHRIVYFSTSSMCRGLPPCLETDLRPALFAINGSELADSATYRVLTWPSIRQETGSNRTAHVDSCFGRYGPDDFDLGVNSTYKIDPYDPEADTPETGIKDAHDELKRADTFAEAFRIITDRFRSGLADATWAGIDNGLRAEITHLELPDAIPPEALAAVPELSLQSDADFLKGGTDNAKNSISTVVLKGVSNAISKRNDGEYTLLHFIEPKAHPAPPEAATDVDIVLSSTAGASGLIIEEILLGRAFLAGTGPGVPVLRQALTKFFRLFLVLGLFVVDTLPLVLLLSSEIGVANYRGLHVSGTAGSSIFGLSMECPAGFPLGLGSHVTLISVSDARVPLIASTLAGIMIVRIIMLFRKLVQRKDTFVATFQNVRAQARGQVAGRHAERHPD